MDFKEAWSSIVNSFFAIFFALQISAVIMWDQGLLKWISVFNDKWLLILLSSLSLLLIFAYFFIDWLDATLVSSFDKRTTRKDIFFWILSPTLSSIVTVLIIKAETFNIIFVALFVHFLVKIFSLKKRDEYADIKIRNEAWKKKDDKEYNRVYNILSFSYILFWTHIVLFLSYIGYSACIFLEVLDSASILFVNSIYISFVILLFSLISNFVLKYQRHKYIFTVFYIKSKEVNNG